MKKHLAVVTTVIVGVLVSIGIVVAVASASPKPSCGCTGPVRSTIDGTTTATTIVPESSDDSESRSATATTVAAAEGGPSMMPIGSLPMPTDPSDPTTVPTTPLSNPVNARQITVHGHGMVGEIDGAASGDTDRTAMQDKARVAAMSDAKHRARTYASAAGAAVGPVVSISEYATPAAPGGTVSGSSAVAVDVTVVYQLV